MSNNDVPPIEIGLQKAKDEILQSINMIGKKYSIPSSIILLIVEQIVQDTKINTYESIIGRYDVSMPGGVSEKPTTTPKTKPVKSNKVVEVKSDARSDTKS